jgi:hypothetical protein
MFSANMTIDISHEKQNNGQVEEGAPDTPGHNSPLDSKYTNESALILSIHVADNV